MLNKNETYIFPTPGSLSSHANSTKPQRHGWYFESITTYKWIGYTIISLRTHYVEYTLCLRLDSTRTKFLAIKSLSNNLKSINK